MTDTDTDGRHDFDFLHGTWRVSNRTLGKILVGSDEWKEFPATSTCRGLLDGLVNVDEIIFPERRGGVTVRTFDKASGLWSIYWITAAAELTTPVVGRFDGGRGEFFGEDSHEGTPVRVRYRWQPQTATAARWEQAYSPDAGDTWETNWIMECVRV